MGLSVQQRDRINSDIEDALGFVSDQLQEIIKELNKLDMYYAMLELDDATKPRLVVETEPTQQREAAPCNSPILTPIVGGRSA